MDVAMYLENIFSALTWKKWALFYPLSQQIIEGVDKLRLYDSRLLNVTHNKSPWEGLWKYCPCFVELSLSTFLNVYIWHSPLRRVFPHHSGQSRRPPPFLSLNLIPLSGWLTLLLLINELSADWLIEHRVIPLKGFFFTVGFFLTATHVEPAFNGT